MQLKLERAKLKGCNKGFRVGKQIALKAARGPSKGGGGWWWGWWCLLKREVVEEKEGRRWRDCVSMHVCASPERVFGDPHSAALCM